MRRFIHALSPGVAFSSRVQPSKCAFIASRIMARLLAERIQRSFCWAVARNAVMARDIA